MELSLSIRTAYFSALSGNITNNGVAVPIYDVYAVPDGVSYPYILLSSQVDIQRDVDRCKVYDATILVDIVTGSTDPIGRAESEGISGQIDDIINPDTFTDLTLQDYTIGNTKREQAFDGFVKNDMYYIYRKLIRYNHLISKN